MTDSAKEIYKTVQDYLESHELYNAIDRFELTRLAEAIDLYKKYDEVVQKRSPDQMDKGFSQTSTYLIWKRADDVLQRLADKYGLTPIGRKRLGITSKAQDVDPLSEFMG